MDNYQPFPEEESPVLVPTQAEPVETPAVPEPVVAQIETAETAEAVVPQVDSPAPAPQPAQPVYPVYQYQQPPQPVYAQPVYAQPVQPQPQKPKGKFWKRFTAAVLIIALVASGCLITGICVNEYWEKELVARNSALLKTMNERMNAMKDALSQEISDIKNSNSNHNGGSSVSGTPNTNITGGLTPAQVYTQNVNSVVIITCTVGSGFMKGTSQGSGFVLTADGYIATNYHVVEGGSSITVKMTDGKEYAATYVGGDQTHDIALLKADAAGLTPVTVGSSDRLIVGDQVVAIGYPLSTEVPVLTVGYVSAKNQIVDNGDTSIRMLQTDAAINSGNSGGPLFNMKGEVVGITSAKYSGTSSSGATIEGVGFAIPMDDVIGKFNDLKDKGYISGAYLGISAQNVTSQTAADYGLPVGVYVVSVTPDSCAKKAGMKAGDVIVNLAGHEIASMSDLSMVLQRLEAGDEVTVTVFRASEGSEIILDITLDEKPQQ